MMAEEASSKESSTSPQDPGMSPDAPISPSHAQTPQVPPQTDAGADEAPKSDIPTVEVPAAPAEAAAEPAAEAPKSDTPTVEVPPAKPADAASKAPGKPADKAPAKADKDASEPADDEKPFDPATDLPMYREGMDWFVLRVASNKENYVRETLMKKVQIEGLLDRVGRIMVPTEKTKTLKGGKARITETKLYPGYIFVEMQLETDGRIPQDVFFLIKETTGVGDFVGTAGRPTPMAAHEVEKMLFDSRRPDETPTVKMEFAQGDFVTITEGPFESYEGSVDEVLPDKGLVRVLVSIFGRQAPVELEYWQIEKAD